SGDTTAADSLYMRSAALVNPATDVLLQDCIARQRHESSLLSVAGESIAFRFEAVDREGNITTSSTNPVVVVGTSSVSCAGDPCACCLMLQTDPPAPPPAGCSGLEGMPAPDLPGGLCRSF